MNKGWAWLGLMNFVMGSIFISLTDFPIELFGIFLIATGVSLVTACEIQKKSDFEISRD